MKRISTGAVVGFAGFGFAIVGLVLPYLVKKMPEWVSLPLVAIGGAMIVVPCLLWMFHRFYGQETDQTLADELDSFIATVRLSRPVPLPTPRVWHMTAAEGAREALRRETNALNLNKWERNSLVEYHDRFRSRVLPVLQQAGSSYLPTASEPHNVGELVEIVAAIKAHLDAA